MGIPEKYHGHVFKIFQRLRSESTYSENRLAIARNAAELMESLWIPLAKVGNNLLS